MGILPTICFIVCHAGPAEHFDAFARVLEKDYAVKVWAAKPAHSKFSRPVIDFDPNLPNAAEKIALSCQEARYVVTDLGAPFCIEIQKALARYAPHAKRIAYYDNPEASVPGEYNKIADRVSALANRTWYANPQLADHKNDGIGYYPIEKAQRLQEKRKAQQKALRAAFFRDLSREDRKEKIVIYLGGHSRPFYEEALPAFRSMAFNDPSILFFVQKHPSCTALLKLNSPLLLSPWSTESMLLICDTVLYSQTSMAPMIAFAGIPIIQVGKQPYRDLLIRMGLPFAKDRPELQKALSEEQTKIFSNQIVGYRDDWEERLRHALIES